MQVPNLLGFQKIEKLQGNTALKHLDLSENEIDCLGDLSKLVKLKVVIYTTLNDIFRLSFCIATL